MRKRKEELEKNNIKILQRNVKEEREEGLSTVIVVRSQEQCTNSKTRGLSTETE
jgi:hypothetical protein